MKVLCIVSALLVSFAASAGEVSGVVVDLPEGTNWEQVTEQSNDEAYLKEWIPAGKSVESTEWIVVQQMFKLERKTKAKKYLESMLKLARNACTDLKYNGPEKRDIGEIDSYWARLMCAQVVGKEYGTFTEFRVIADGTRVFVVTSELRLKPTKEAGMFAFGSKSEADEMMEKLRASARIARDQVRLCAERGCS